MKHDAPHNLYAITKLGWIEASDAAHPDAVLRWSDHSDRPFDRFGRLDALSQYAVVAVEHAGITPFAEDGDGRQCGVVFATTSGCGAADMAFARSVDLPGGASPMLFSCTVPSTPLAAITSAYRIHGPSLCIMHQAVCTLGEVLDETAAMLDETTATQGLAVVADVAEHACALAMRVQRISSDDTTNTSAGWLLQRIPPNADACVNAGICEQPAQLARHWRCADLPADGLVLRTDSAKTHRLMVRCR